MTPAVNAAKKAKTTYTLHEYSHDPKLRAYGEEAVEKLQLEKGRVFKTLVVANENGELFVALVPVTSQLSLKRFAKVTGSKKAAMADKKQVEKTTGYVLGGVSPLGQKKRLATIIHETAEKYETIYVSAGKRGLEIELAPDDLKQLTSGKYACICD